MSYTFQIFLLIFSSLDLVSQFARSFSLWSYLCQIFTYCWTDSSIVKTKTIIFTVKSVLYLSSLFLYYQKPYWNQTYLRSCLLLIPPFFKLVKTQGFALTNFQQAPYHQLLIPMEFSSMDSFILSFFLKISILIIKNWQISSLHSVSKWLGIVEVSLEISEYYWKSLYPELFYIFWRFWDSSVFLLLLFYSMVSCSSSNYLSNC